MTPIPPNQIPQTVADDLADFAKRLVGQLSHARDIRTATEGTARLTTALDELARHTLRLATRGDLGHTDGHGYHPTLHAQSFGERLALAQVHLAVAETEIAEAVRHLTRLPHPRGPLPDTKEPDLP